MMPACTAFSVASVGKPFAGRGRRSPVAARRAATGGVSVWRSTHVQLALGVSQDRSSPVTEMLGELWDKASPGEADPYVQSERNGLRGRHLADPLSGTALDRRIPARHGTCRCSTTERRDCASEFGREL
ncbi:hypothetical protein SCOCK_10250 [Actinacidiphila cocklensis]|uniref:Uncharacterized protein n=1 Tax=Actinacidiphila cocklensis TaxID=887465 RepID=A0A9W4DIJ7_9ACTN|nr:hypothetical protein SCOCK_10250 [Actinacidiphila cocklensis]